MLILPVDGRKVRTGPSLSRPIDRAFAIALFALCCSAPLAKAADLADLQSLYKSGEYEKCAEQARVLLISNPTNEDYSVVKIRAEMELGQYTEAAKTLAAGLKNVPRSFRLRCVGRDVLRFA